MKNKLGHIGLRRLSVLYLIMMTILVTGFSWMQGSLGAGSSILGGLAYCIPQLSFALVLFGEAQATKQNMKKIYRAEAIKWGQALIFFILAFAWYGVKPEVFFCTYMMLQLTAWLAPWIFRIKQTETVS